MIRNVLDHAIETPEERRKRGVPEAGNLWLQCESTRTHLRFIIQDDGRGIDPARLRKKVVEKGVLTAEQAQALDDEGAIDLIFHPGFSTAEKISEVSGRGVGMDVVRTKVREHEGDITVASKVGVGTTFTLEIPIRQAVLVIDGLLVEQSGQQFVLPFEHIREITEIDADQLFQIQGTSKVAVIRGTTYGAVPLGEILKIDHPELKTVGKVPSIVVGGKQGEACILVDRVLGHRQVVVHQMPTVRVTNDIAGVAQLGGGRMALVVSVPDVVRNLSSAKV
jgi:two-component system chemotaxis sensor kinase CheA